MQSTAIHVSVCWYICMPVCLSTYIFQTPHVQTSKKISVQVNCGRVWFTQKDKVTVARHKIGGKGRRTQQTETDDMQFGLMKSKGTTDAISHKTDAGEIYSNTQKTLVWICGSGESI